MTGLTAGSVMPYGKYQGRKMSEIPADYLLWLWHKGKCSPRVAAYVEENMDTLKFEVEEIERKKHNRALLRTMYK